MIKLYKCIINTIQYYDYIVIISLHGEYVQITLQYTCIWEGDHEMGREQVLTTQLHNFVSLYMHFMDIVIHWMVSLARTHLNSRLFLICICNNYNIGNLTFTFLYTKSSKCV